MAIKIRRRSKGFYGSIISDQYLTSESKKALNNLAKFAVQQRIGDNLRESYRIGMESIAATMAGALTGTVRSTGPKRVAYTKLDGGIGRISTTPWARLSERYLNPDEDPITWTKKIPGTPFWRNTGDLASAVKANITFNALSARGMVKDKFVSTARTHHKNRFRFTTLWSFKPLRDPIADALIRAAFVNGEEGVNLPTRMDLGGYQGHMWKMWINEFGRESRIPYAGRPFIVRLAAALGREMHTRARKVA